MKFRQRPVEIQATRWFRNGDHPEDDTGRMRPEIDVCEGAVVRYYRRPETRFGDEVLCPACGIRYHEHGFIDVPGGGYRVCPGDWIVTENDGERRPCKPDLFEKTYHSAEVEGLGPAPTDEDLDAFEDAMAAAWVDVTNKYADDSSLELINLLRGTKIMRGEFARLRAALKEATARA